MDLKQIEKLMAAMERSGIRRMVIKEEGYEIELEREGPIYAMGAMTLPQMSSMPQNMNFMPTEATSIPHVEKQESPAPGKYITSPMIGTFYASSSPGSPPFIKVGDTVTESSVVCIVEAMKVMNEIKASISGVVAEILVKNGEPLEFGTKLFRII